MTHTPSTPQPPAPMDPEDIPDEVVEAAFAHYSMHGHGLALNLLAGALPVALAPLHRRIVELEETVRSLRDDMQSIVHDLDLATQDIGDACATAETAILYATRVLESVKETDHSG